MEKTDVLWPGGFTLCWDDSLFPPGTDSFLLGAFPRLTKNLRVCDLGSGTGLLGLLLLAREPTLTVTGIECQAAACALAERNAADNGLTERLITHRGDLRTAAEANCYDLVIANPPYFKAGSGRAAGTEARQTARAEDGCTVVELCAAAARRLAYGGRLALVFRPERLTELFAAMTAVKIEPKRLRWVQHRPDTAPSLVLVEGKLGGRPGLSMEAPLILRDEAGRETPEVNAIYFRNRQEE
ncbi:MAG: methyltransferase [Clostridiales bacterium]|nr:methyltransferase [Clostridiales bacterium]